MSETSNLFVEVLFDEVFEERSPRVHRGVVGVALSKNVAHSP